MDGNSHCELAMNWNVCQRSIEACQKIVTEQWVSGELKHWNVRMACGNCPFQSQVKTNCDPDKCLTDGATCDATCFPISHSRMQIERCYECTQER